MAKFLPVTLLLLALAVSVFASDTFYVAELEGNGSAAGRSGIAFLVVLQGTHTVQGYYFHNAPVTLKSAFFFKTPVSQRALGSVVKNFKSSSASGNVLQGLGANSFSFSTAKNRAASEGIWNGSLYVVLSFNTTYNLTGYFYTAQNYFFANLNASQNVPALTSRNTTADGFGFVGVDTNGPDATGLVFRKKANKALLANTWIFNDVANSVSAGLVKGRSSTTNLNGVTIVNAFPDSINGTTRLTRFFGASASSISRSQNVAIQNGKGYLVVKSQNNPNGDVRGQLVSFSSVNALLTGLGGGQVTTGVTSPNFGSTALAQLSGANFDSQFCLSLVTETGGFDGTFFWEIPSNLAREALGRASFPIISIQGIRINFNLQVRLAGNTLYSSEPWMFELLPKNVSGTPLVIAAFDGFKRRFAAGFQRFEHAYVDIDGSTLADYVFPSRKIKVHITYAGTDQVTLAVDQLAIQVVHGNKHATAALRSLDLVPSASSLLPN